MTALRRRGFKMSAGVKLQIWVNQSSLSSRDTGQGLGRCDESASSAQRYDDANIAVFKVLLPHTDQRRRAALGKKSNGCLQDLSCRVNVTRTCVCLAADQGSCFPRDAKLRCVHGNMLFGHAFCIVAKPHVWSLTKHMHMLVCLYSAFKLSCFVLTGPYFAD